MNVDDIGVLIRYTHLTHENYWSNRCVQWLCGRNNTNGFGNKNRNKYEKTKYWTIEVEIIKLNHTETS